MTRASLADVAGMLVAEACHHHSVRMGSRAARKGVSARFVIFHDKVQVELKVTDDQKTKLRQRLESTHSQAQEFFRKAQDLKPS